MRRDELTRRGFLRTAAVAGAAAMGAQRGMAQASRKPNFVFLFTDDQTYRSIHALNNPEISTPNMDRLVGRGTSFTHCFIQGSLSGAVCVCSRSMLMTGRSLFRSPLSPSAEDGFPLWPQVFRDAGYSTFGTGKWHNGKEAYALCFSHGSNIFFGGMHNMNSGGHATPFVYDFDPDGQYPDEARRQPEVFSTDLFADSTVEFLNTYTDDAPYFAYVPFTAPHDPRMAPETFAAMYPPGSVSVPPNFLPEHPFDNGEMKIRDEALAPWPRTPEVVQEHRAAYYAMVSHTDYHVGRILDAVAARPDADNTYVIFTSDNGLAVGEHGLLGKQNMYDHSMRVPLIVAGPDVGTNRRVDDLVHLHDIFPSTCELAGLETPGTVESRSIAPLINGTGTGGYESVFGGYRVVQRMVRTDRHKLIRYPMIGRTQLFDMREDPYEMRDLSGDPAQAATVAEMNAELASWQRETGDALDLENPRGV